MECECDTLEMFVEQFVIPLSIPDTIINDDFKFNESISIERFSQIVKIKNHQ